MYDFTKDEKVAVFDKIAKNYFNKNFGTMTKSDFELLLFSEYIECKLEHKEDFSDYILSKELGITQSRIRSLKERKELIYPHDGFNWKDDVSRALINAKYDEKDHKVRFMIEDINVQNELRHFIEQYGWYDECSLNKKLSVIPIAGFVDIFGNESELFSEEAKKSIEELSKVEGAPVAIKDFLKDFTKDGLKEFLMTASKTGIKSVLPLIPFGEFGKVAFDFICKAFEK